MEKIKVKLKNNALLKELVEHYNQAKIGLEKESLRFSQKGISKNLHPKELGSPLTNKYITTDFSEALIEFITPPLEKRGDEIDFLEDAHYLVHKCIDEESLWPFSTPPFATEENIVIAQYGTSNLAKFKELYRSGLAHRYGKAMQIIAGLHFNFSFSNSYLEKLNSIASHSRDSSENEIYLGVIRNIYRNNWLILYLFGSSPIVSNNLLGKGESEAIKIDSDYSYFPNATSIRMSDIGYQNTINKIEVSLSSLDEYTDSLNRAMNMYCRSFSNISEKSQISKNVLQIEDEYYSAARPKSTNKSDQRLAKKLSKYGIQYLELRSIDLNPFEPIGINLETILFLEIFMVYCSIIDSPNVSRKEFKEIRMNDLMVSRHGRNLDLKLRMKGQEVSLRSQARDMLNDMLYISELLDSNEINYSQVVLEKIHLIEDSSLCLSSIFLDKYFASQLSYFDFGYSIAQDNKNRYLMKKSRNMKYFDELKIESSESITLARKLEEKDSESFDSFMEKYFYS